MPSRVSIRGIAAAFLALFPAAPFAQAPPPRFVERDCGFQGLSPDQAAFLRCGTVEVPALHATPEAGGTYRLAVVLVRAGRPRARPEPVLMVHGGPGSGVTHLAPQMVRALATSEFRDRDRILVDQRGAGRGEPSARDGRICPNTRAELLGLLAQDLPPAAYVAAREAGVRRCAEAMRTRGWDPMTLDARSIAEDMEAVRLALGVERWDVYGVSYGAVVTQTMMALHPATIRAVVLDSPMHPQPGDRDRALALASSMAALGRLCAADTACARRHPRGLEATFRAAQQRLGHAALAVPVSPDLRLHDNRILLNRAEFEQAVLRALYRVTNYAELPEQILAVAEGRGEGAAPLASRLAAEVSLGLPRAAMLAVACGDIADLHRPRSLSPEEADGIEGIFTWRYCDWRPLSERPPLQPRGTAIPTLIVEGDADPITPPDFARRTRETLGPRAQLVLLRGVGHSTLIQSPCAARLATSFLREPRRPLEVGCAARPPPIVFAPRRRGG